MNELVSAAVSIGELIDKITILEIKLERFSDQAKRANVAAEFAKLQEVAARHGLDRDQRIADLRTALKQVNETLWEVEEKIRRCEHERDFGAAFVELARAVYRNNDERARLKYQINMVSGSALVEEKSY
jgi:hypothetical protein